MKKLLLISLFLLVSAAVWAGPTITQRNWRWRADNGNQTSATWLAAENTAVTINDLNPVRLRLLIDNDSDEAKSFNSALSYATSASGPWIPINTVVGNREFSLISSSFVTHGEATTSQLTGAVANAFVAGKVIQANATFDQNLAGKTKTEYEWVIKPNNSLEPSTTYYFKMNADEVPSYPTLVTSATLPVTPKIVSNGGFEADLNGWQTFTLGTSAATYEIVNDPLHIHLGSKALKVSVTNRGSFANVKMTKSGLNLDPQKVYMLKFWAFSETNNAIIDVNLKGATTNNDYHYQISRRFDDTKNGWQMYYYPFKVTESPTTLELAFNSNAVFYLDDIEIISEDNQTVDVKTQYKWHHNRANYGWVSGDNDNSVKLPDGRIAWIFSDAFIGPNQPYTNVINGFAGIVNNMIVLEEAGQPLKSLYNESAANTLFSPGNGNIFWNSGGVVDDGKLKVLLAEVGDNGGNDTEKRFHIGSLNLPNLTVSGLVKAPFSGAIGGPYTIFQDGAYNYIYIEERVGNFEVYTKIVRVPTGSLNATTPWELYMNDNTWAVSNGTDANFSNAKRIISNAFAGSVVKLGPNSYALSATPHLSNEIAVWFAQSPEGPWVNKTVVYSFLPEENVLAYAGHIDKGTGAGGEYSLSFSVYPFIDNPIAMQLADKGVYLPVFVKANLVNLSPFGAGVLPVSFDKFEARAAGNRARLDWSTFSETNNDRFEVDKSSDGKKWTKLTSVKGNGTVTAANRYTVYDDAPLATNYYKLKQIDLDGTTTELGVRVLRFNIDANKDQISIYPNPVISQQLNLRFDGEGKNGNWKLTLSDLTGRTLKTEELKMNSAGVHPFALPQNLANGVYLLNFRNGEINQSKKIVIQH